jgi:hypothetical protein
MDELRVVAHYALESAEEVLPVFEDANPGAPRPRAAINAAREFVNGAKRTELQRITSLDAHRAAKEATTEAARLAARAAGDAASAAYLHPIARAAPLLIGICTAPHLNFHGRATTAALLVDHRPRRCKAHQLGQSHSALPFRQKRADSPESDQQTQHQPCGRVSNDVLQQAGSDRLKSFHLPESTGTPT